MLLRKAILLAGALLIGASASFAGNANGIGYFALEIPTGVTMNIDGNGDDWGWFDQTFAYGPDDMIEIITGEIPSKADIDVIIMTGWTGADRDNRLYGFARVTDDTLHIAQTEPDNGWLDDDLEIIPDADNSGGPMKGEGLIHSANGQQFTMHISEPGGYDTGYGNGTWWLRHQAPPEMHWVDALAEANIVVEPAGATNLTPNVVVNYEYAMPIFDELSLEGEDASIRHILTAGETIGLTYQLNEADTENRDVQLSTAAENGAAWDATFASDYTLLAIGEYDMATAVESSSWGLIKASFDK